MKRHDDGPLAGHRVPGPPAALERRVLAATSAALHDGAQETVWDRLWTSRPLRVAWSVAVLVLVSAHTILTVSRTAADRAGVRLAAADPSAEIRQELALPTGEISPRAEALALGRRPSRKPAASAPADTDDENEVPS